MSRSSFALAALALVCLSLLLSCGGRGEEPPFFDLTGVPVSDDLRGALRDARLALAGPQPDDRIARNLAEFETLRTRIRRVASRAEAGDRLYELWRADPDNFLWIDLGATMNGYLLRTGDRNAMYALPVLADSATAVGAYVRGRRFYEFSTDGEWFRLADERRGELDAFRRAWLDLKLAMVEAKALKRLETVRALLDLLPTLREAGGSRLEYYAWSMIGEYLKGEGRLDDALHATAMAGTIAQACGLGACVAGERRRTAMILAKRREYGEALALCERVYSEAVESDYPWVRLNCACDAGALCQSLGDSERQLAFFELAAEEARIAGDSLNIQTQLINVANSHLCLGRTEACGAALARAQAAYEAYFGNRLMAGNEADQSNYEKNVAMSHLISQAFYRGHIGDYGAVDTLLAKVRRIAGDGYRWGREVPIQLELLNQGLHYGNPEMAYQAIDRLDELERRGIRDTGLRINAGLSKAQFLITRGEFARARRLLDRIAPQLPESGEEMLRWRHWIRCGDLAQAAGDPAGAERAFREALRIAESLEREDRICDTRFRLGHALLVLGRHREARELAVPSAAEVGFGGNFRTELSTRLFRGLTFGRAGDDARALAILRETEALCLDRSPADIRTRLYIEIGRSLARLGRIDEAAPYLADALELATRRGDRVWMDELEAFNTGLRREALTELLALYAAHPGATGADDPDRFTLNLVIGGGTERRADPRAEEASPIATYFVGESASHVWVDKGGRVARHALPGEAELNRLIRSYLADAARAGAPVSDSSARAVSEVLLAPVLPGWEPGEPLLIRPDGALADLPWSALPLPGSAGGICLDRGPVTILVAGEGRDGRTRHRRAAEGSRLLAIGIDAGGSGDSRLPALRHAEAEAREVASLWPAGGADLLTGDEAVWSAVAGRDLSGYDVLHIATHATVATGLDAEATIRFSEAGGDTPVTAGEISALDLNADLVFLSCCEAAGRMSRLETGTANLAGAFLEAGAGAVVAAGIRVDDEAARRLASRFYHHLLRGADPAEALRSAQRDVRAEWPHPAHWAFHALIRDDGRRGTGALR